MRLLPLFCTRRSKMTRFTIFFGAFFCVTAASSCQHLRTSAYASVELLTRKSGESLSVCSADSTSCCTRAMETRMVENAAKSFQTVVDDKIIVLRHLLHSNSERLRAYFLSSLSTCHTHLDTMFNRTYGRYYQHNKQVFASFFSQLRAFGSPHSVMPTDLMVDSLFEQLYKTLFQILNPLKAVDVTSWRCMRGTMDQMRPFGEVPERVKESLRRALEPWRTLMAASDEAHHILGTLLNASMSGECTSNLARMSECSLCTESKPVKPCLNLCMNVAKGCLADYTEVDQQWDTFVGSLKRLAGRMAGAHNLQHAFTPLPVQLSEAIMIFQDKGATLTNKVLASCFPLEDAFTHSHSHHMRSLQHRSKRHLESGLFRGRRAVWLRHAAEQADGAWKLLAQVVAGFAEKVAATKGFFNGLPQLLCSDPQFSSGKNEECWTGDSTGTYRHAVVGDGTAAQRANPEYQGARAYKYRGLFIDERLRMGMLAVRVNTVAGATNDRARDAYQIYGASGANPDDEDDVKMEASGDLTTIISGTRTIDQTIHIDKTSGANAQQQTAKSSTRHTFFIVFLSCFTLLFQR